MQNNDCLGASNPAFLHEVLEFIRWLEKENRLIINRLSDLVLVLFGSFLISFIATWIIKRASLKHGIVDQPGERRSHQVPTPRGGGMAIVLAFLIFLLVYIFLQPGEQRWLWGILLPGLGVAILGFLDDLFTLSRKIRILVWVIITGISILFGISIDQIYLPVLGRFQAGIFSPLVTFIWLIGVTNFFNFMDGINGLAGMEVLLAALFLGWISYQAGNGFLLFCCGILLGGVIGFLPYNFPNAKIFLGDGGSNFLGYIFAAMAIVGSQTEIHPVPLYIFVMILNMFLLDAGVTLVKRLPKGKEWLEPHREHTYQVLIDLGYSHVQVTLGYTFLNIILGILALLAFNSVEIIKGLLFLGSFVPYLMIVVFTEFRKKNQLKNLPT